jgi:hypothetical protein
MGTVIWGNDYFLGISKMLMPSSRKAEDYKTGSLSSNSALPPRSYVTGGVSLNLPKLLFPEEVGSDHLQVPCQL